MRAQVSIEFSQASRFSKHLALEQRYAIDLRKLVYDYTLNPTTEIANNLAEIYKKLGDLYIDIGRITNKAEDYTDAAVFYQYVLSIVERIREELKDEINQELENYKAQAFEQLDIIYTELAVLVSVVTDEGNTIQPGLVKDESKNNRRFLEQLREEAEQKIKEVDEVSLKKEETESVYESEEYFINETRRLFEHIAKEVKEFAARIFRECEEIMGAPPCKYSVIGLGSLALNQFTPYSDLEFAILTENEEYKNHDNPKIKDYFKNLSHLVHFKVICLRETIIPTSKYGINLESFVCRGFNFDLGGKTPLGRVEKDKNYELIQTPEKMARYLNEKYAHVDKNLPYILEASCFIYGEEELFTDYRGKVTEIINIKNKDGIPNYKTRTLKRLKEGVVEYNYSGDTNKPQKTQVEGDLKSFAPNLLIYGNEGKLFNVKLEIYRLPDRFLYTLALYFGIESESAWDAVDKLKEKKVIGSIRQSKHAPHYLKYAASFAIMLRIRTYLANKGQFESMVILEPTKIAENDYSQLTKAFSLPEKDLNERGGLFKFYYTVLPLHNELNELNEFFEKEQIFITRLNQHRFFDDSKMHTGHVFNRLGRLKDALKCYIEAPISRYRSLCLSKIYYVDGCLDNAENYLKETMKLSDEKDSVYYSAANNLGVLFIGLKRYDEAIELFNEALVVRAPNSISYANILHNKGQAIYNRNENSRTARNKALKCFIAALKIIETYYPNEYNNLASILHSIALIQEDKVQALHYCKRYLSIIKENFGESHQSYIEAQRRVSSISRKHDEYNEQDKVKYSKIFEVHNASVGRLLSRYNLHASRQELHNDFQLKIDKLKNITQFTTFLYTINITENEFQINEVSNTLILNIHPEIKKIIDKLNNIYKCQLQERWCAEY